MRSLRRGKRHCLPHEHHLLQRCERRWRVWIIRCCHQRSLVDSSRAFLCLSSGSFLSNLCRLRNSIVLRLLHAFTMQCFTNFKSPSVMCVDELMKNTFFRYFARKLLCLIEKLTQKHNIWPACAMHRAVGLQRKRTCLTILRHARWADVIMHRLRHGRRNIDTFQVKPVTAVVTTNHLNTTSLAAQTELALFSVRRLAIPSNILNTSLDGV